MKYRINMKTKRGGNNREHWRTRHRRVKRERGQVALACRDLVGRFPRGAELLVLLVRVAPGTLDDDNLRGSLKAVRDEVARLLGRSDDAKAGVVWDYGQRSEGYLKGPDGKTVKSPDGKRVGVYAVEVTVSLHGARDVVPNE